MSFAPPEILKNQVVLYFAYVWPEPESSAAGVRVEQNLKILAEAGAKIHLASAAKNQPRRQDYPGTTWVPVELNSSHLDELVKTLAPTIVIYDRFVTEEQFGARVEAMAPDALRIIDTQDLHFLRRARGAGQKGAISESTQTRLEKDERRELAAILRADLSLILSDFEFECLVADFGIEAPLLHWYPFAYAEGSLGKSWEDRSGFSFLGNLQHEPNLDGVEWLLTSIWPRVLEKMPKAKLSIAGAYPPPQLEGWTKGLKGVELLGPVADAGEFLGRHRWNLAPLRFGAGIKGKIAEAWRVGTPSISTSIGVEGMGSPINWGGVIADGDENFIAAMVEQYKNREEWQASRERGLAILHSRFSYELQRDRWLARLTSLLERKTVLRESRKLAQILRDQKYRSTEYFSRWIELKEAATKASISPISQ